VQRGSDSGVAVFGRARHLGDNTATGIEHPNMTAMRFQAQAVGPELALQPAVPALEVTAGHGGVGCVRE